jgi:hypothetical protein
MPDTAQPQPTPLRSLTGAHGRRRRITLCGEGATPALQVIAEVPGDRQLTASRHPSCT